MRLSVLKVSIPVLMLAVFQTGDCGVRGSFARLDRQMSGMTPMQRIEAFRNFKAEVEGQPAVQPAPAQQPVQQSTPQVEDGSVVQPVVQQPLLSYVEDPSANKYDNSDDEDSEGSSWFGNMFRVFSRNGSKGNSPVQSDDESESEIEIREGVNAVSMSIGERTFDVAEESFVTNSEESFCEDAAKSFVKVEKGGEYSVDGRKYSKQCAICSLSLTPEEEEKVPVEIREKLSNAGGVQADDSALWKRIAESVQKRIFVYECQENRVTAFYEYGDSYEDLKRVCLEGAHYQQLVEEK